MTHRNKGLRLHFKLVMHFVDGTSQCTSTYKKMKIIHHATRGTWEKAYIKITYRKKYNGEYNDGWYENKKDLLDAIQLFTEAPLRNYLNQA